MQRAAIREWTGHHGVTSSFKSHMLHLTTLTVHVRTVCPKANYCQDKRSQYLNECTAIFLGCRLHKNVDGYPYWITCGAIMAQPKREEKNIITLDGCILFDSRALAHFYHWASVVPQMLSCMRTPQAFPTLARHALLFANRCWRSGTQRARGSSGIVAPEPRTCTHPSVNSI